MTQNEETVKPLRVSAIRVLVANSFHHMMSNTAKDGTICVVINDEPRTNELYIRKGEKWVYIDSCTRSG